MPGAHEPTPLQRPPTALVPGEAHMSHMTELFKPRGASYPVVPPPAPGAAAGSELLEDDEEALDLLQW